MTTQDPTNKTTRPGCNRNGPVSNTEETIPMSTAEATALIERAATELPELTAEPTMLAAPRWATASTLGPDDVHHVHESPVRFGVESDKIGRPIVRCGAALSQLDYLTSTGGSVVGTDRQGATIDLLFPNDTAMLPIGEARVLHGVLGGLLTRYDAAESPASPSREVGPWPCLPDCTDDHPADAVAHECSTQTYIGKVQLDYLKDTLSVEAIATSVNADTFPTVLLERSDLHPDEASQVTSAQARELAALLLAAADKADALAARPDATVTPAGA